MIYLQVYLTFIASKRLKIYFTLNSVLKRSNDFTTAISNWLVLLSTSHRKVKPFRVTQNRSRSDQTQKRYNEYRTNLEREKNRSEKTRLARACKQQGEGRVTYCLTLRFVFFAECKGPGR